MNYFEVTEHSLEDARPGLLLVEQLLQDEHFTPYLYGLTTKPDILLACEAAIDDDGDTTGVSLKEVAVAIEFSADTIYYLQGSGLKLQHESFAYIDGSDGPRTLSLRWSGQRPTVRLTDFSKMALSDTQLDVDSFLMQYASRTIDSPTEVARDAVPSVKASSKQAANNPIDSFLAD